MITDEVKKSMKGNKGFVILFEEEIQAENKNVN